MIKPPMFLADISARAMSLLDAEKAHATTVRMLAKGLGPKAHLGDTPRLSTSLAGLSFPNPIGLAAGFDKNAEAPNAMLDVGFGFVEVGAVTPRPQPGNDRPRVFRLREDCAVINRYGFNNEGLEAIAARLAARPRRGIVGINLGANKNSADRVEDYVAGVKRLEGLVDFYTVNISSPNTPGLRALQDRAALMDLLTRVLAARDGLQKKAPLFLKIAPDLTDADKADIADCARVVKLDALVVSNTTITRSNELRSKHANEKGGLSGAPLFAPSTALLREFYGALHGAVPLIGVGGVFSARDAYKKILAGASLVQLYTALVYQGPGLVARIVQELPTFLDADGFPSISDAVGAGAR
ncbi:MAG: quinone-dependent dihydroorotate dehydrogenase [Parvularculaceae bacterium]